MRSFLAFWIRLRRHGLVARRRRDRAYVERRRREIASWCTDRASLLRDSA